MDKSFKKNIDIYNDVTLLIVCYNSELLIKKNLKELKKFKTILIDNSNSKQTFNLIKDFPNINYIKTTKNLGYGQANNLGAKKASTPFIMILNPDILINSDAIKILFEKYLKYENAGILAPSLYDNNNKRRTNGSNSRLKKTHSNDNKYNIAQGDTCYDFVVGCSLFMNKDFFQNIGGFDNDFFMYFEDNELCDRIYANKKCVIEIPDSKMVHMQGLSSKHSFFSNVKLSIIHKISEYIYYKKNLTLLRLYIIIIKHFFDYFQRCFKNLLIFRFKKSFKNMLRLVSIFMYITKLYKIIY